MCALLLVNTLTAAPDIPRIKTQVRDWHATAAVVEIKLSTGAKFRGTIVRVETDTFVVRQLKPPQDFVVLFADVSGAKKRGGISKAVLIPMVVGGAAVLILCAAPYPIGFLCHRDPS